MVRPTNDLKNREAAAIARKTAEFLEKGGKITELEAGFSGLPTLNPAGFSKHPAALEEDLNARRRTADVPDQHQHPDEEDHG